MRTRSMVLTLVGATAATAVGLWALGRGRTRANDSAARDRVTYPPLNVPKRIGDGVWIVDSGPMQAMGLQLPLRMTILELGNGDLMLHSPTQFTDELAKAIEPLGRIKHLVAPNIAHWMFLADWQRAYPDATSWGAPGLRDRAQVQASDVRIDAELGDAAPSDWADTIEQGVVSGAAGFREVWFFHKKSRTLVLVDLIENLEPDKLPPLARLVMRASAATNGTTAPYLRLSVRLGGEEAKRAIRAAIALEPEQIVFSHGRLFDGHGAARLRQAFAWLV